MMNAVSSLLAWLVTTLDAGVVAVAGVVVCVVTRAHTASRTKWSADSLSASEFKFATSKVASTFIQSYSNNMTSAASNRLHIYDCSFINNRMYRIITVNGNCQYTFVGENQWSNQYDRNVSRALVGVMHFESPCVNNASSRPSGAEQQDSKRDI